MLRRWVVRLGGQAMGSARRPITQAPAPSPADLAAENARLRRENERLRMERDILKKSRAHLRIGLPMKFRVVDEHRRSWPVRVMCAALDLSVSGYYAWRARPESRRVADNRALLEDIRRIHAESDGTYGSPRVHAALRRGGCRIGHCRVERLMRRAGLRGLAALPRRTRTTDSRHAYPIAPNRLGRNFLASRPGQVWLADLTYIPTGEGWLYLAAVLDLHTRKIVGWSMRERLYTEIALEALNMAIERQRPAPGLIHHSDRGIQYAAEAYRLALGSIRYHPIDERQGQLPRQCPDGKLLSHPQGRAGPSPDLCHPRRCPP